MGFMDKVKATAEKAAEKAQQGVNQGKEKLSDVQDKRKLDAALRDLGAAVYLDRAGKGTPALTADIERLLAEVREMEAAGAVVASAAASTEPTVADAVPDAAATVQEPTPEGSYKLEDV